MYTKDIRHFVRPDKELPFFVKTAGTVYCDETYRITKTKEEADVYVIGLIMKGTGTLTADGKNYRPSAGDLCILKPGTAYECCSDWADPWTIRFVNVNGGICAGALHLYGLEHQPVIQKCRAENIMRKFIECAQDSTLSDREVMVKCVGIFMELVAFVSSVEEEKNRSGSREMHIMMNYLNENAGRLVGIRELAQLIYRSPDYTIKLFDRTLGQSPYDFQIRRKIDTAKEQLIMSGRPIAEIAAGLGFTDPQHFSKLFKSKCGLSPRAFRKNGTVHYGKADHGNTDEDGQ